MKRILVSVANALTIAGLAASAALAAPGPGSLPAASTVAGSSIALPAGASTGHGAVVAKGAPCLIPVPGEPAGITTDSHSVVTPAGNVTLTCHTSGPKRGATFTGRVDEICFTPGGVTSGHLVATRSGRINLSCHIHPHVPQSTFNSQAAAHRWQHGAVAGTGPHPTQ
jgi:hypothetical protein